MPRYVIETDEQIDECWKCPCLLVSDHIKRCMMARGPVGRCCDVIQYGRDMGFDEGRSSRPSWCPLKPLEDSSLTKQTDATLTSVQHFINDSGTFPVEWNFETIRCHGCDETFIALVVGRSRFCPRCGARLNVTHASEVRHPSYRLVSVDNERRAQELKELRKQLGV